MRTISKRRQEMGEEAWAKHKRKLAQQKVTRWRRRIKLRLIEYKGGKCQWCGYNKPVPAAYHFHHRDPSQKEFGIAQQGACRSWSKVLEEVDKCDLICANCHAETYSTVA